MNQTTTTTTSNYVLLAVVETMLGHLEHYWMEKDYKTIISSKYTDS